MPAALVRLRDFWMLTLEPERLKKRSTTTENMLEMNELFPWGRSGSLRLQFLSVEVFSLLPQSQRDRCNLARQRQPHHGWLDAFGE